MPSWRLLLLTMHNIAMAGKLQEASWQGTPSYLIGETKRRMIDRVRYILRLGQNESDA